MLEKKRIRIIQILCLATLTACQVRLISTEKDSEKLDAATSAHVNSMALEPANAVSDSAVSISDAPSETTRAASTAAYQAAINLASSAFTLGQQAISSDDWDLIIGRWEQAIQNLNNVSPAQPNYAAAQTKLKEYERNLAQAKRQLAKLQQPPAEIIRNRSTSGVDAAIKGSTAAVITAPTLGDSARIPIIERLGGTPVIEVTFNGRRYPMILDTGASHTHIPRAMANELGLDVIGQASVATASNRQVAVDVGYIESVRVGNITHRNLPVSIGDAVPIGLLGNDVYKNFDVILQVNSVEFRPR